MQAATSSDTAQGNLWKDVTAEQLRHLIYVRGLSYSKIGEIYGVNRGAVSGKVWRMKLQQKTLPRGPNSTYRKREGRKPTPTGNPTETPVKVWPKETKAKPKRQVEQEVRVPAHNTKTIMAVFDTVAPPDCQPVTILEKREGQCATVLDQLDEQTGLPLYCGAPVVYTQMRWCAYCASRFVNPDSLGRLAKRLAA